MANALLQVTNLNALLTYQNLLSLSGRLLFELQSNITSLKRTNTFWIELIILISSFFFFIR